MEYGKPFLLNIFTFNDLHGYLVENRIQTLIIRRHIVFLVWFIKRAWAACDESKRGKRTSISISKGCKVPKLLTYSNLVEQLTKIDIGTVRGSSDLIYNNWKSNKTTNKSYNIMKKIEILIEINN